MTDKYTNARAAMKRIGNRALSTHENFAEERQIHADIKTVEDTLTLAAAQGEETQEQLKRDRLVFGTSFKQIDGEKETRIDPRNVFPAPTGEDMPAETDDFLLKHINAALAQHECGPIGKVTSASKTELLWGARLAIKALRAQDAGIPQEAVAWQVFNPLTETWASTYHDKPKADQLAKDGYKIRPLYASQPGGDENLIADWEFLLSQISLHEIEFDAGVLEGLNRAIRSRLQPRHDDVGAINLLREIHYSISYSDKNEDLASRVSACLVKYDERATPNA